jgi:DNA-binding YbaB/EbfC family protein
MPGIDIHHLMRQARKVEAAVQQAKEKLGEITVEAEAGGGLVKVRMDGTCTVLRIEIDPKIVDPNDKSMLEDLVTAGVNAAAEKARAAANESVQKATGGIQVPGLPF